MASSFDLGLGLEGTHIVVTGGLGLIGRVVSHAFLSAGCNVSILDTADSQTIDAPELQSPTLVAYKTNITDPSQIHQAFSDAEARFGPVQTCVALASLDLSVLPQSESLADMDPEAWKRVFDVNVHGTFVTCQRWLQGIRKAATNPAVAPELRNVSLIIMGSEAGRFGVRTMAAYAAGKSAVQEGLMRSLAQDAPRLFARARVNAVAPGAVDTARFKEECERYGEGFQWRECEAT
ncbi:uncharacterized protein LTR77_007965 [Saxophila tyrrhenica]|uniref:NAD(P)-binding protein n=1 Tax=Saxophila tyrrhenica TaxID=1690608 RepID=A0AAV9P1H1_9PEZI|nr:hypothetical protein LTR77_007965 [Saxophila tyrrhenica]